MSGNSILDVRGLRKEFLVERGFLKSRAGLVAAVDGISFRVNEFSSLGIAGESGSGKTTLAKMILKLIEPTAGEVLFDPSKIRRFHKDVQAVFQNPFNSLDPKMRVIDTLLEPLAIHRIVPRSFARERARELLSIVGLDESALTRYPDEFSGGQRQRIAIARALASEPRVIVLDEPLSSLDLTVQAKMLKLFKEIKERRRLTYLFISHNLAVIRRLCDSALIMRRGRIVEEGATADL
ncbi:MAG: ATP-binding cassette domain-containing protein, partial [Candidatus Omnitrophota bacterium]